MVLGADSASIGFEHDSHRPGLFETRIRHQNSKFMNFGVAGIRIGFNTTDGKLETSEVLYENLIFANNGHDPACVSAGRCGAIAILNFNERSLGTVVLNRSEGGVTDPFSVGPSACAGFYPV
eukprot:m.412987 g.412987  ORF g.412987 m.412987 type:complete len:122 (+) comp16822_c1_seq22:829-1194(+)